jgi:hypothetical protein
MNTMCFLTVAQKKFMLANIIVFVMLYMGSLTSANADTVDFVFTTIDHPLDVGGNTSLNDINDSRQIVGIFHDGLRYYGFVLNGSTFTTIEILPVRRSFVMPQESITKDRSLDIHASRPTRASYGVAMVRHLHTSMIP